MHSERAILRTTTVGIERVWRAPALQQRVLRAQPSAPHEVKKKVFCWWRRLWKNPLNFVKVTQAMCVNFITIVIIVNGKNRIHYFCTPLRKRCLRRRLYLGYSLKALRTGSCTFHIKYVTCVTWTSFLSGNGSEKRWYSYEMLSAHDEELGVKISGKLHT